MDLKRQYLQIKDEIHSAISEVINETAFSGGSFAEKFENEFAAYCQIPHVASVNSGSTALHLALKAAGIEKGDEVIVPANTFIATPFAVSYLDAIPVFADCLPNTWNIDPADVRAKITPKTKAILGVHLYGQPFDADEILKICDEYNLMLIEDCAQAHGATYNQKQVGCFGKIAAYSFYPGKNLGAYGEGGGITSSDKDLIDRVKLLRNYGSSEKYFHREIGYNMRMDGLQGAILSVKLKYLAEWTTKRQTIAQYYLDNIQNPLIRMQHQPSNLKSVFHLFVITTPDRQGLLRYLGEKGIFAGMHYPLPCHLQEAYQNLNYKKGDFPNSEYLSDHCVSLPMFAELTQSEIEYIVEKVNEYKG